VVVSGASDSAGASVSVAFVVVVVSAFELSDDVSPQPASIAELSVSAIVSASSFFI